MSEEEARQWPDLMTNRGGESEAGTQNGSLESVPKTRLVAVSPKTPSSTDAIRGLDRVLVIFA